MKKRIILFLMSTFLLTACSNNQKKDATTNNSTEKQSSQYSSDKTTPSTQTKKDGSYDFSNDEVELKINNVTTGKGMENTNIVFIDYSAKNKSSVSVEAQNLFMNYITVFQNGVEFEVGHAFVDSSSPKYEEVNKLSQEVYPNEQIQTSFIYALNDTESPIELRYHDRNSDKIIKTETYELN